MDYMKEMLAFTDWLETNPLEPSAQTLWFHLMVIANKSGYPEWFAVTNPLLQAKVGISEKSLSKHRNTLVQKGLIDYKNQGKQQAGKYRINSLTEHLTVNFTVNRGVKGAVKHTVKGAVKGSAYKDLKDLDLKSSSSASSAGGDESLTTEKPETFYQAHERVFGFGFSNPMQAQRLGSYLDDGMEEAVLVRALERAALASTGYSFGLIDRIVKDYYAVGAMDIASAEAFDAAREADQQSKQQRQTNKTSGGNRQQKSLSLLEQRRQEAIERERERGE